jgi:hypothetical protein
MMKKQAVRALKATIKKHPVLFEKLAKFALREKSLPTSGEGERGA